MPSFNHIQPSILRLSLALVAGITSSPVSAALIQPVFLSDTTTEVVQTGYSQDVNVESLEYWFDINGITRPDGGAIDVIGDQIQSELFHIQADGTLEIQYLGAGYAAFHSPFGIFTYSGDPYLDYDSDYMSYQTPLFIQNEVADGATFQFNVFADTYLGFYLDVNGSGTMLSSLNAANPGGGDNFLTFETNAGFTFAIEDIPFGGDRDYEDLIVNLSPVSASVSTVSAPATLALVAIGLIGIAGTRRSR